MAHQMLDYVWERPKGVLSQEIGGSGLTLLALAAAAALDADTCEQAELDRVLAKSDDHFKERNAVKNDAGFLAVGEVA
jgi:SpoVK/Ycf46/Vps4 family AAA+-type ATPase